MAEQRVDPQWLTRTCIDILQAHGLPAADAALVADTLVVADLWGHGSHGVLRLPWYADRLRTGAMSADAQPEIVHSHGAIAVLDGHNGIGQVITHRAAQHAIAAASEHGIAAVAVRNSNHFGTAAYYTRMAADANRIGLLATNSSPAMPPWGGLDKLVGSNPWSVAVPVGDNRAAVLDISNTSVARGKLYRAKARGESIPEGWAITAEGHPTTDPTEALNGLLQPMGEHKGYAISFMVDMLSGVLTGSGFGAMVNGPYQAELPGRCGHLYIALDIDAFLPEHEFPDRAQTLISQLKSSRTRPDTDAIQIPGELEDRNAEENQRYGVPLPDATLRALEAEARSVGQPWEPQPHP